jgi:hypothetical protein
LGAGLGFREEGARAGRGKSDGGAGQASAHGGVWWWWWWCGSSRDVCVSVCVVRVWVIVARKSRGQRGSTMAQHSYSSLLPVWKVVVAVRDFQRRYGGCFSRYRYVSGE